MSSGTAKAKVEAVKKSKARQSMMRGDVHFWNADRSDVDEAKSVRFIGGANEMALVEEKLEITFSSGVVPIAAMVAMAFYSLRRVGQIAEGVELEDWRDTVANVDVDDDDPE